MRVVIDILILAMLAAILTGVVYLHGEKDAGARAVERTRQSLEIFEQHLRIQQALNRVEMTSAGYPRTIDPDWFKLSMPRNYLVTDDRPWLEVAGLEDRDRRDPVQIVADRDRALAKFWYNPYNGVVRARVPAGLTDAGPLVTYNQVNETSLERLIREDHPE
ncbi:MAG: hypothetical protein ACR2GY_07205 [Phycisphaerales bacterium]